MKKIILATILGLTVHANADLGPNMGGPKNVSCSNTEFKISVTSDASTATITSPSGTRKVNCSPRVKANNLQVLNQNFISDAYLVCEDEAAQDLLVAFANGMGALHGKLFKLVNGQMKIAPLVCNAVEAAKANPF